MGCFQARILERVAIFFSRGSSWPRDGTYVSCIGRCVLYPWAFKEALEESVQFSSVQSLSRVWLSATPWIAACRASLSITNSWSPPKLMSIESVIPSSHLILCRPLLLLPPIPPSIRVFSNASTLCMRWPKYWSFSFSISPSNEHPGLISLRMDWLDLLVQRVRRLKSRKVLRAPPTVPTLQMDDNTSVCSSKQGGKSRGKATDPEGRSKQQWKTEPTLKPVLKEINPEYSLEGLVLKLKLQYLLWPLDVKNRLNGEDLHVGKDWRQEEKGASEDEMVGWNHQLDGHELVQTPGESEGQGSVGATVHWISKSWMLLSDWTTAI